MCLSAKRTKQPQMSSQVISFIPNTDGSQIYRACNIYKAGVVTVDIIPGLIL